MPVLESGNSSRTTERRASSSIGQQNLLTVDFVDLFVQRAQVVKPAQQKQTAREEVHDCRQPFPHVKTVDTEGAQEREQNPSDRIIEVPRVVLPIRLAVHAGNQEQIDQPPDSAQSGGQKPDRPADLFAIVESVRSGKSEDPQNVANGFSVSIVAG